MPERRILTAALFVFLDPLWAVHRPQIPPHVQPQPDWPEFTWPADHTGWRPEAQINGISTGLSNNWTVVPYSTTTNRIMSINKAAGSGFFRLAR